MGRDSACSSLMPTGHPRGDVRKAVGWSEAETGKLVSTDVNVLINLWSMREITGSDDILPGKCPI